MSKLETPDVAVAAADIFSGQILHRDIREQLGRAAPLIIAAELRRLADELDQRREQMREEDDRTVRSSGLGEGIRRLRERADELEPTGRGSVSIR